MTKQQINLFNSFSLVLTSAIWFLPSASFFLSIKPGFVILVAFFVLFVPGANIVYLVEKITRQNYQFSIFVSPFDNNAIINARMLCDFDPGIVTVP